MTQLKPGDRINCRIKQGIIVSPYKDYDEMKTFEIVAVESHGYYLFVPSYYSLKGTRKLEKNQAVLLEIERRFVGEEITYIDGNLVHSINFILDGMKCCQCHEFFIMAEPNQEDGTLICYSCRFNPYR